MGITHYTWDASYKKVSPLQISPRKGHRTYAISEAHTEKSQMLYKMPLGVCSDDEHQRVCSLADGGQEAMKESRWISLDARSGVGSSHRWKGELRRWCCWTGTGRDRARMDKT